MTRCSRAGAEAKQDVKDVGGGKLIASVTDADGNVIGLIPVRPAALGRRPRPPRSATLADDDHLFEPFDLAGAH